MPVCGFLSDRPCADELVASSCSRLSATDPRYVLFDNWYASIDNLAFFKRLDLRFVTRSKHNFKVEYEDRKMAVSEVAATVQKANDHYYAALGARARSFQVKRDGQSLLLVVIKNDRSQEAGRTKYLLTDDLSLTTRGVVEWYRRRWPIEVFFRDCKQLLGMTACEARAPEAIISHFVLVCVAYTPISTGRNSATFPVKDSRVLLGKSQNSPTKC
ncbi:MAG: transposase [Blastocatellia bacterium]